MVEEYFFVGFREDLDLIDSDLSQPADPARVWPVIDTLERVMEAITVVNRWRSEKNLELIQARSTSSSLYHKQRQGRYSAFAERRMTASVIATRFWRISLGSGKGR